MKSTPNLRSIWLLVVVAILSGCNEDSADPIETSGNTKSSSRTGTAPPPRQAVVAEESKVVETPVTISEPVQDVGLNQEDAQAIVHEPIVALSTQHEQTCLVNVDTPFPSLEAKTLDGQIVTVDSEYGDQATVVVFWNLQYPMAIEQISRINEEVVNRFRDAKVKVLAINVGATPEDVRGFLSTVPCDALCLLDEESKAFGQLATGILPRTYLIDSNGVVRWLDLEYSRSTRRELRNAIIFNLRMQLATKPDVM